MKSILALPIIYLIRRAAMLLTLGCCGYIIFFLLVKTKEMPLFDAQGVSTPKSMELPALEGAFDILSYDSTVNSQVRDIFSLNTNVSANGVMESTPKGQLPDHLKVVGILVGHPSQIIIEDSTLHKTYFIDEGNPQAGISILKVADNQMIINYQGQNISVPISKT